MTFSRLSLLELSDSISIATKNSSILTEYPTSTEPVSVSNSISPYEAGMSLSGNCNLPKFQTRSEVTSFRIFYTGGCRRSRFSSMMMHLKILLAISKMYSFNMRAERSSVRSMERKKRSHILWRAFLEIGSFVIIASC